MMYVAAGLILNAKGEMLMAHRHSHVPRPLLWENPGGKIEKGETPQEALRRELLEELGIEADVGDLVSLAYLDIEDCVQLQLYAVPNFVGKPKANEAQTLRYVDPTEAIRRLPCMPATYLWYRDIVNFIKACPPPQAMDVDMLNACKDARRKALQQAAYAAERASGAALEDGWYPDPVAAEAAQAIRALMDED